MGKWFVFGLGHACDNVRDGEQHGGFYTQDELRGLVGYAARCGVTVVPEIDLPGHTQAAIAAYPRFGNDPATPLEVWTHFGLSRHILNVEEATVRFMCDVLDELVDVFPSPYVHLGGDEVLPDEWLASPAARARMAELGRTDPEDLVGWWIRRLGTHLAGAGRRLVAWDELADHDAPDRTVIMAWRNQARVRAALSAGFDVVAAPHTAMYLNYPESRAPGEPLSIGDGTRPRLPRPPLAGSGLRLRPGADRPARRPHRAGHRGTGQPLDRVRPDPGPC